MQQMISYNANLDETIKLAQDLSRNGVNWRKVGQFLTGLACCAVLASGVAFFFVSAQVSLALLGIDTFLNAAAWFLKIESIYCCKVF